MRIRRSVILALSSFPALTLDRGPESTVQGMTKLLSIPAHPDAPVACDMTAAEDTLAERMAEYRRLFDHALLARESADPSTTFRLAALPGVRDWVLDLVRREAACCPFLSYEVDAEDDPAGDQIVWILAGSAPPTWPPRRDPRRTSPDRTSPLSPSRSSSRNEEAFLSSFR